MARVGIIVSLCSVWRASSLHVDVATLKSEAAADAVTSRVFYKLDGANAWLASGEKYRAAGAAQVADSLGCSEHKVKRLFRDAGKHEAAQQKSGLNLWYQAECASPKAAVQAIISFATEPATDSVALSYVTTMEPELKAQPTVQSDDPLLSTQTHYPAIGLYDAWELERGSPSVVVQVLDTGIDMSHEDLQLNIWTNPGEICGNGVDDDNNGYVDDCHGYNHADDTGTDLLGNHWHGTHCGGTIAADTDNGIGVAGVAGGTPSAPGVKLMISVGFGDFNTGGFAEALVYGANNGAQISSNSWGYTSPGFFETAVRDAIDYYNSMDGIVVFAAGNDNADGAYYPGYYTDVVAVAAVADSGVRASFSNYGDWIDISAPGVQVYSTLTSNSYGYASGTSMACPHMAGVFALGLSANPAATKADLLACAYSTATDLDSVNPGFEGALGAGYVDAPAFVQCAAQSAPSPSPTRSMAPTTAAPTLRPTASRAPTPSCVCDQTLELELLTDNYPGETTWTLEMTPPSSPDCVVTSESGGPYSGANTDYGQVVTAQICAGEEYTFTINDAWGDGVCCGYGQGSYSLKLDGAEVAGGGEFGTTEVTTFTAPGSGTPPNPPVSTQPTPSPSMGQTPGPTLSPTASPTPRPTASPIPAPTPRPTASPIPAPTPRPTASPIPAPTASPTPRPTASPTFAPTSLADVAPAWALKILGQLDQVLVQLSALGASDAPLEENRRRLRARRQ